jgi:DNA-binding LytR/AlgR family response regulator
LKIKLICKPERYEELSKQLEEKGIQIDNSSTLVLREEQQSKFILAQDEENTILLKPEELVYIESFGDTIIGHTMKNQYELNQKLYEFEGLYEEIGYIRVHKSYVVNIEYIELISASFNTKLTLTMKNKDKVTVSRSYYHKFKEKIGM